MNIIETERLFISDGKERYCPESFCELPEQELSAVQHFVEINRHAQEIKNLFLIFKFNIEQLRDHYTLMHSGDLLCGEQKASSEEDFIAVNAYVTNILSAGHTLVESMEAYVKENEEIDESVKNTFFDYEHGIYDTSFAYRLLIRLRDFTQHGHLAVSKTDNIYFFDLKQILEKPHFTHNKKLGDEIKQHAAEIIDLYKDTPTISLTQAVAEYVSKLLLIYQQFWKTATAEFQSACLAFDNIAHSHPENFTTCEDGKVDLFFYEKSDAGSQAMWLSGDFLSVFEELSQEAKTYADYYFNAYEELMEGTILVKLDEQKRMSIDMITFP